MSCLSNDCDLARSIQILWQSVLQPAVHIGPKAEYKHANKKNFRFTKSMLFLE